MKNLLTVLTVLLTLTSCKEAYETLSTPFKYAGQGLGYIGSTVVDGGEKEIPKVNSVGAYEVSVKAPAGSVINTAIDLFHKEARRICGGATYKHKITHKGTTPSVEYLRNTSNTQNVPTVKGLVICNKALEGQ